MALVTAPDLPARTIQWTFDLPGTVTRSGWTGERQVVANPWHGKWRARVELATIQGEENARTIKSFFARCKGPTQTFRLYATAVAQNANTDVTVSTSADAGDTSLVITGEATALSDGQMVTVNGQLLCCTADQSGSTIAFRPPLRQAAPAGTPVVTSRPYALVHMTNSVLGWRIGPQRLFGMAFDVEEAVLEEDIGTPETSALLMEDGSNLLLEDGSFILLE